MKTRSKTIRTPFVSLLIALGIYSNALAYVYFENDFEQYAAGSWPADNIQEGYGGNSNAFYAPVKDSNEVLNLYSVPGWDSIALYEVTPSEDYRIEFKSRIGTAGLSITIDSTLLELYPEEKALTIWNPIRDYGANEWHEFIMSDNGYGELIVEYYVDKLYLGQYTFPIPSYSGPHPIAPLPYLTLQSDNLDLSQDEHFYFEAITNVPIPSPVWLLGSGLIGLVGLRKKFTKS